MEKKKIVRGIVLILLLSLCVYYGNPLLHLARLVPSGNWSHLLYSKTALETARPDSGHRHRLFSVL